VIVAYIESPSVCLSLNEINKRGYLTLDMLAMTTSVTVQDMRLSCCEGRQPCVGVCKAGKGFKVYWHRSEATQLSEQKQNEKKKLKKKESQKNNIQTW